MSIFSRPGISRPPAPKADDPSLIRASRFACPRCGTINCTDHSACVLTSRAAVPQWKRAI